LCCWWGGVVGPLNSPVLTATDLACRLVPVFNELKAAVSVIGAMQNAIVGLQACVLGLTTAMAEIKPSLAETRETLRIVEEWAIGWANNHPYGDVVQSSARPNLKYGPGVGAMGGYDQQYVPGVSALGGCVQDYAPGVKCESNCVPRGNIVYGFNEQYWQGFNPVVGSAMVQVGTSVPSAFVAISPGAMAGAVSGQMPAEMTKGDLEGMLK